MLTLLTQPEDITLARNPVQFSLFAGVFTNTPYASQPLRAFLAIGSVSSRFANGETLSITYTEPSGEVAALLFTASTTVSSSTDIPSSASGLSDGDYWETLIAQVQGHPRIAPFFSLKIVAFGGLKLRIQCRDTSPDWEITVTNTGGFTVSYTALQADQTPPNLKVLLQVFFERTYKAGDYDLIAQLEGRPDEIGTLRFDLSSILSNACRDARKEPIVPVWDTDAPIRADNTRRYFVRYAEEYGNPVQIEQWFYSTQRLVIDGGVAHGAISPAEFLASRDADNALLTWMPSGRSIDPACRECITWYNWDATPHTIVLERIFYNVETGLDEEPDYMHDVPAKVVVQPNESLIIPVQPILMGYNPVFPWYKMVVRVTDATSAWSSGAAVYLSEPRTYFLDHDYYRSRRYLSYLNSFGAPEILPCTGEYAQRLQASRSVAIRPLVPGANDIAVDSFAYGREATQTLTYRTGFLQRGVAEVMQEAFMEAHLYDVSPDGYIPLRLTGTDFDISDSERDLHSFILTVSLRLSMQNYSKSPVSALATAANWQDQDGSDWFDAITQPWQS
jgi:hypothetical protein